MSENDCKYFFECNTDKFFIKENIKILKLNVNKENFIHSGDRASVYEDVRNNKGKSLGLVDLDPHGSHCRDSDTNYKILESCGKFKLQVRKDDPSKKVIQIVPDMESCLLEIAKKEKIDPGAFNLKNNPFLIGKKPEKNPKYAEFIVKLIEVSSEIKKMREWIKTYS